MGRTLVATFDNQGALVKDAMLLFRKDDGVAELQLLAGLLSSSHLGELYARQFITIDVLKNALLSLPLPGPLDDLRQTAEGQEIIELVERLIGGSAGDAVRKARQTRIDYLAAELYARVFE